MTRARGATRAAMLALGVALTACAVTADPTPPAGDLLSAPTQLNFAGRVVALDAAPRLSGPVFRVDVRLRSVKPGGPLPQLNVQGVYVVARAGVWTAPYQAAKACTRVCLTGQSLPGQGVGRGEGIDAGEVVQVVLRVKDAQGRAFWLRAERTRVASP